MNRQLRLCGHAGLMAGATCMGGKLLQFTEVDAADQHQRECCSAQSCCIRNGELAIDMSTQSLCDGLQAPELYAMAMAAADALGVTEVPELWLQSSAQAAVHYLRMPLRRFHGLDGDLGFEVSAPHFSKDESQLVLPLMPCESAH